VVITFLITHYGVQRRSLKGGQNSLQMIVAAIGLMASGYTLLSMPLSALQGLQMATVPLSVASKLPQIAQILGCLARVYTTSTEVGDPLVMAGFVVALLLNIVLGAQIWIYWGQGQEVPISSKETTPSPTTLQYQEKLSVGVGASSPSQGRRWARKVD
jgi:mannose-P-dolichol utilization defect protein 1